MTDKDAQTSWADAANIRTGDGPPLRTSGTQSSLVRYGDFHGCRPSLAFRNIQAGIAREIKLIASYSISWSGQSKYLKQTTAKIVVQ